MPKEQKSFTPHNKLPYTVEPPTTSATPQTALSGSPSSSNIAKTKSNVVEFVWEPYEQQSPSTLSKTNGKQPFLPNTNSSPSNSSGGIAQLLGFSDDDPIGSFAYPSPLPSASADLMGFPSSIHNNNNIDNDPNKSLSPPSTTTSDDPFKKHSDLSSFTSTSFHIACTACREKHIKCGKLSSRISCR
jgi:hypothetical protein